MARWGIAKGFGDLSLVGDSGRWRVAGHVGRIAAAAVDILTADDNACGYIARLRAHRQMPPEFLK